MAVATESHGQIQEFLDVLRKRRWQIALPALYVLTVGIALAVVVPKKYEITTEVEIRESRVETDYQLRDPDESATKQELQNARQHIQHFRRIRSIIEEQPDLWKDYFALDATERGDYVRRVMGNLKVEVAEKKKDYGSTFITVTYTDVDGARGTKFLTRLSDLWIHEVIDQDRQKLEKERDILQDQEARVRKEYNRLNQQYIDLAKQMDIDPTRPLGLANPVDKGADPYYTKYYELVSSGQDVDSDLARAEGALETMRAQLESEPLEIQTEAKEGGTKFATEIQQLSSEILFAETQRSGLTPLHSRHVRLGDHIKELQAKIDNYRALESEGGVRIVWQPNPRRQKLIEDIAVKEIEVQGLRTQLGYLRSEVVKQSALLDARAEDYRDLQDLNDERATSKLELNIVHTELGQKMRAIEVVNKAWGDPTEARTVTWPLSGRAGRKPV